MNKVLHTLEVGRICALGKQFFFFFCTIEKKKERSVSPIHHVVSNSFKILLILSQANFYTGLGTETVGSGDKRIMLAVVAVPEVKMIIRGAVQFS